MKYIYLTIFLGLLIAGSFCEKTSYLKKDSAPEKVLEAPEPKTYSGYCFMKMKNQFYDLNQFNMIKPWKLKDNKGQSISFNFCSNIDTKCAVDNVLIAEPTKCKKLSGRSEEEKTWTLSKDKKKNDVITIAFPQGDSCGFRQFYQTTVELTCDPKANVPVITNNKTLDLSKCKNTIKIRSRHGNLIYNLIK